jgi:M6 family metalloprotease-like protein
MKSKLIVFLAVLYFVMPAMSAAAASDQGSWRAGWNVAREDLEGPDYLKPPAHYRTLQMMLAAAGLIDVQPGPPPQPVFGNREILVILVELSDVAPDAAHTTAYFDDRFFDTSPPSVRDYYEEVSYGAFRFVPGDVLGWYASTYSQDDWVNVDPRPVIVEAIQDVDADFDFAPYDADSDGTVTNDELTIFIIVSGDQGGAFHWYTTSSVATGDGVAVEGEFCATHEERHIGSYCHELGHDLGLPDLYDTDDTITGDSEGIGNYGLMGGGSWTFSHMTAWSKIQLGWLTPTIVTASGYHDIDDAETNGEAYILVDPAHSTTEYFLVENRHSPNSYYETVGAPIAPNGPLPDDGLVIYHIDDTKADDWINSGTNNVNVDETHKCVDVETAEHQTSHVINADDLDAQVNRGDADDLWDCNEYDFDASATPCTSVWYGGGTNEISVRQMGCVDPTITAYLTVSNEPPVAACQPFSAIADEECCIMVTVADIDGGSYDPDGVDDIASLCITALDGSPVACADEVPVCGAGEHDITLTITDLAGLSDACTQPVEVIDANPPELTVTFNRDVLWPPNHRLVDITAYVTVEDNCDPAPSFVLTSVSSNEPDNGVGDGNTTGDIQGVEAGTPDTEFQLRSERAGGGDGRIYTVVYTATDASGNTVEQTYFITVPHDQSGSALASLGFNEDGTDFDYTSDEFVLIVPSVAALYVEDPSGELILVREPFDASILDPTRCYAGNTAGAVRPTQTQLIDVTGDGLLDLALFYPTAEVVELKPTIGELAILDEQIQIDLRNDGPVGLHYHAERTDYLVPDIFALGPPVPLVDQLAGLGPAEDSADQAGGVPQATCITAISPNPFNPSTTIGFYLESEGVIALQIYDARGKLIRDLVSTTLPRGHHEISWNGRDLRGRTVATGVYLVHLEAGGMSMSRSVTLLK